MASAYTSTVQVAGRSRWYRGWVSCEGVANVSDTTARVTVRAMVDSKTIALYGIHVDALVNGRVVASRDHVLNNYGGWRNEVDMTASLDVPRSGSAWDCPVQVHVYGRTVSGYGSAGGDVWATVQAYVPQRGYSRPNPPRGCSLARVSDSQQRLSWSGDYTDRNGAKPWDGIYVDRRTDGGQWDNIANLSWSATGYTDSTTSANHSYEYRLCAHGPGGNSEHVSCGTAYTTPAAPSSVTIAKASQTTVTVSVTGTIRTATSYEVQASVNGGSWSALGTWATMPRTVNPGTGYAKVRVRSRRGSLASAWVASNTVQSGYAQPSPPKSASLSRVSDAAQRLSWQGDYTGPDGPRPWDGVYVDRRTDGGTWQTIADLPSTAVNYTDGSTSANHSYEYRLSSHGPGGRSPYVSCGTTYTTPAAPSSVTISKASATTVTVGVTGTIRTATSYEAQTSVGGAAWSSSASYASMPQVLTTGAGAVRARVRACRGSLASAWVESATVQTVQAPLAPAVAALPAACPSGTALAVRWTRNHPDGTAQTAAQVEVTQSGTATTYDAGTSPILSLSLADGTYSVRVRTRGLYDGWGAWSFPQQVRVCPPPQCHVASPGTDGYLVDRVPLEVEVEASDATGIAQATLTLTGQDGTVLLSADVTDLKPVSVGDYATLSNGSSYLLTLAVRGGSGLSSTSARRFTTHWATPATPVVDLSYDAALACHVIARSGESAYSLEGTTLVGPMAADSEGVSMLGTIGEDDGAITLGDAATCSSFVVERSYGGGLATVAAGVPDGSEVIDRIPPLNADYSYVVTGISESGTSVQEEVAARVAAHGMALNFGADASRAVVLDHSDTYSTDSKRVRETFHFADGGENGHLPMSYPLDERDASTSAKFWLTREGHDEMERVMAEEWQGWWRGHAGERAFGAMGFSMSHEGPGLWQGSVSVEHDVFEEPANG